MGKNDSERTAAKGRDIQPIVIVGAGQAGAWAARTLRDAGYDGRIVLCGAESHAPYERPPLSKGVLSGAQAAGETQILGFVEMTERGIEFNSDTTVVRIDLENHFVLCANDQRIAYSRLLLCTGGRPLMPPILGATLPGVRMLRTLDEALALRHELERKPRIAIVGGGWISLEVAATARGLGCEVEILEAAPRLCSRSVMPAVSEHLARLHKAVGVRVHCGAQVESIAVYSDGKSHVLTLATGDTILADMVLLAAGMVPNDGLARAAGLSCDHGIYVDSACRTSDPDVFAAGDVAVFQDTRLSTVVRLESWQNAQDQGSAAARAMIGQDVSYCPLPLVWSEQYDQMIQIAGYPSLVRRTFRRSIGDGGFLYLGLDEQGRMAAAIGLNAGRDFRVARKWVEQSSHGDLSACVEIDAVSSV